MPTHTTTHHIVDGKVVTPDPNDKKYTKLKPGLYMKTGGYKLGLIYVLSGKKVHHKKAAFQNEWSGTVYKYWDFHEENIYEFNNYWYDMIDRLVPITDERILDDSREQILKIATEKTHTAQDAIEEWKNIIQESK